MQRLNTNPKPGLSRYSALSGRITTLLNIFSDGKPHKAAELAQIIGVNSRTIRRTLHMMRDEMGIPLEVGREGFLIKNGDGSTTGAGSDSNDRDFARNIAFPSPHLRSALWPVSAKEQN